MNRGDRLVFSNGVVFLAIAAGALLIAFGGITTALIPLYAVGVFTSFTLSQSGMVKRHLNLKEPGWRKGITINGVGATATGIVLLIVAVTKFTSGAWLPIVVIPLIILLFIAIRRHYDRVSTAARLRRPTHGPAPAHQPHRHRAGRAHPRGRAQGPGLRPLAATPSTWSPSTSPTRRTTGRRWSGSGGSSRSTCPWRSSTPATGSWWRPVVEYIDEVDARWGDDTVTVVIPEFVVGKWWENILHNQSALFLKGKLLFRTGTVVTSVPYHVDAENPPPRRPAAVPRPSATQQAPPACYSA